MPSLRICGQRIIGFIFIGAGNSWHTLMCNQEFMDYEEMMNDNDNLLRSEPCSE